MSETNGHAVTLAEAKDKARRKTVKVPIEAFGGDVVLREMGGRERDEWEDLSTLATERKSVRGIMGNLISMCWVDESGERVCKPEDTDDFPASVVSELFEKCIEINRITQRDVEVMAKN